MWRGPNTSEEFTSHIQRLVCGIQKRGNFSINKCAFKFLSNKCFVYFVVQKGCVELRDWSTADEVHFLAKRKKKGKKQQDMQR